MRIPALVLAFVLALNGTLGGVAIAQVATEADRIQDAAVVVDQKRQDAAATAENTRQDNAAVIASEDVQKQLTENTQQLEAMTSNQRFIVQILQILLPLLSLVATGVIAILQIRARSERHVLADESRSNLSNIAKSINGMKTELVAMTQAKAFLEGVAMHAAKSNDPDLVQLVRRRAEELNVKVDEASAQAAKVAEEAAVSIESVPDAVKAIHP